MVLSQFYSRYTFHGIGFLLLGFLCIALNKKIASAWIKVVNDVVHVFSPKRREVSNKGSLYNFLRIFFTIIGVSSLIYGFFMFWNIIRSF